MYIWNIFEYLIWYFRSEWVRYKDEYEKRYFIFIGNNVLFCLLYRYVDDFLKFLDYLKLKIF